jgi:hypothetical protein
METALLTTSRLFSHFPLKAQIVDVDLHVESNNYVFVLVPGGRVLLRVAFLERKA